MSDGKSNTEAKIQIGQLIKEKFHESKLSIEKFADLVGCKRDNVYDIFRRERINTDQLLKISKILQFDFFKKYSEQIANEMMMQMHITINIPKEEIEKGNICEYCKRSRNRKVKRQNRFRPRISQ